MNLFIKIINSNDSTIRTELKVVATILIMGLFMSACTISSGRADGSSNSAPSFKLLWRAPIIQGSSAISWSADSKRLIVVDDNSRGNTVFDAVTSRQISHWAKTGGFEAVDVAMMPDGKTVVASPYPETDGRFPSVVSTINADTGQPTQRVTADPELWRKSAEARPFALSDDGQLLAAHPINVLGRIVIFRTGDWSIMRTLEWDGVIFSGKDMGQAVQAFAFSHNGKRIAAGSAKGAVEICTLLDGKCDELDPGPSGEITALAFTPDDKLLISASRGGMGTGDGALNQLIEERSRTHLRGWDVASGKQVLAAAPEDLDVHFLSIHPSGAFFAVGHRERSDITLFSTGTFKEIGHIDTSGYSGALAFSPDGIMLAASDFNRVMIYKISF